MPLGDRNAWVLPTMDYQGRCLYIFHVVYWRFFLEEISLFVGIHVKAKHLPVGVPLHPVTAKKICNPKIHNCRVEPIGVSNAPGNKIATIAPAIDKFVRRINPASR